MTWEIGNAPLYYSKSLTTKNEAIKQKSKEYKKFTTWILLIITNYKMCMIHILQQIKIYKL
jgi:hypothetical protein